MSAGLSFGEWLKRRRRGLDLTQVELGRRIGYSGETVRKVEAGEFRPSRQMVESLAAALDVPPEQRAAFVRFGRGTGENEDFPFPDKADEGGTPPAPPRHNLPAPPTPLIGREGELAAVERLLLRDEVRVVTVTGAGGTGKTRLALAVAEETPAHFPDGVYLVELAPLLDPDLVASAIAGTLAVREAVGHPILDTLIETLRDKRLLLVLDNLEHLLPAAVLVADLLAACPHLKVLATSRAPLRLRIEHEFPLGPLAVPGTVSLAAAAEPTLLLSAYSSVDLFVQRAQAAQPDFALTPTNAAAVAEICRRLDGLPLALELAAARVRLLPPQAIAARLTHRLEFLKGGPRDAPARQKTMRDTITWSYELLGEREKALFRRLAVFAGGASLAAVEAMVVGLSEAAIDALDALAGLVDHSLVYQSQSRDGEPRYAMLETIREYAAERLDASQEAAAVRRQHLVFYLALADRAEQQKYESQGPAWLERLGPDVDNLRAALAWGLAQESGADLEAGVLLAGLLWEFWYLYGLNEGRRWLRLALSSRAGRGRGRALALTGVGMGAAQQGDNAEADAALHESIAIWRDLGDTVHLTEALHILGHVVFDQQKFAEAGRLFAESLAFYDQIGAIRQTVELTSDMGLVALHEGRYDAARQWLETAAGLARAHDLKDEFGGALERLADLDRLNGDFAQAAERYTVCLELHREAPNRLAEASCLHKLGRVALHEGDYDRARWLMGESLVIQAAEGNRQGIAECLTGLGGVAVAEGDLARSAHLLAAGRALLDAIGAPLAPPDRLAFERDVAAVRRQLDVSEFERCWGEGLTQPLAETLAYAEKTTRGDDFPTISR